MSFDIGINFRASSGYVTDGTNETYCLADSYPTTRGGATFGWTTSPTDMIRDRNSGIDRRLAGVNQTLNNGTPENFQLDLPRPGIYRVYCALGDATFGQDWQYLQIKDGNSVRYTLDPGGTAGGEWWDIGGTKRVGASDWTTNGSTVYKDLKFASSTMNVVLGTPDSRTGGGGTNSTIAHLRVVFIKGVAIYKPSPELVNNGGFDTDTVWNKDNVTISGGVCSFSSANAADDVNQTISIQAGLLYQITYTITSRTSGTIRARLGGTPATPRNSTGTFSENVQAGNFNSIIRIEANENGTTADIDNVSVKLVKTIIK